MNTQAKALPRAVSAHVTAAFDETQRFPHRVSVRHFFLLSIQLALVAAVAYLFKIEQASGFLRILPIVLIGFGIHAWLPRQIRTPFLLILTALAIAVNFGYVHGAMLMGAGLGLFILANLPIHFWWRVGLLLAAAAVLVVLRAEWVTTRWANLPVLVIPVLASMFMFRMIIYMYDSRHSKDRGRWSDRLSYFFMLPNLCFLLFPVIDYNTYRRSYYNDEAASIYQKGVAWIMRGVVHLVLYRLVYYNFLPSPSEVGGILSVSHYMLATYLLYLRISGQFHIIVGILCLFGYNLKETHHLYYLASSFNDYWRRINIYWKDFMMKIFYYPSFMRVRRWGMTTGIVLSTIVVFAGTWLLHAYQWFWLRGSFLLTATDVLFWTILGLFVVINSVIEAKRGPRRSKEGWSTKHAFVHASKVLAMFVVLTVLWSLWSSPTIGEFVSVITRAAESSVLEWMALFGILLSLLLVGVAVQYLKSCGMWFETNGPSISFRRSAAVTGALAVLLLAAGTPVLRVPLGSTAATLLASAQEERLNERDEALMERGYYEGLLTTNTFTSALWQSWKPKEWGLDQEHLFVRTTDDLYKKVLIPMSDVIFCGAPLQTNRWGMRDRDYSIEKPSGTYRIALLGDSHVMGMGVANDETFESIVEERLNREVAVDGIDRFEILNFSVTAYTLLQQVIVSDEKVPPFDPDAVYFVAHPGERERTEDGFLSRVLRETDFPYVYLRELQERANLHAGLERSEARRRLAPFIDELHAWTYQRIAQSSIDRGIHPVWLFMPFTHQATDPVELERLTQLAADSGFEVVSLDGAYDDEPAPSLYVAPWDKHPNARAHRMVADRLFDELTHLDGIFKRSHDTPSLANVPHNNNHTIAGR